MKCIETLIILHLCKNIFLQILASKIARALPGHYWIFTVRYVSQRFNTKARTKPRKYAHFDMFRNVSKPVCKPWGGRGRGFKSRHSDQQKTRIYVVWAYACLFGFYGKSQFVLYLFFGCLSTKNKSSLIWLFENRRIPPPEQYSAARLKSSVQ